jgi:hypothetical protein
MREGGSARGTKMMRYFAGGFQLKSSRFGRRRDAPKRGIRKWLRAFTQSATGSAHAEKRLLAAGLALLILQPSL